MTNIIVLSSILVTNWNYMTAFESDAKQTNTSPYVVAGNFIQYGSVHRHTLLAMKQGKTVTPIGTLTIYEGVVRRKNGVASEIQKETK
jgi:hypothetical protein